MRGLECWLITTEHLNKGLLFKDDEDYKCGMNCVAVTSVATRVNILAFILMSNHTHFVLECSQISVKEFITRFRYNYSRYYCKKYAENNIFKNNKINIQFLPDSDEAFERAIAYVQMNSVAANICLEPSQYPWGTGNLFFSRHTPTGQYLKNISVRSKNKVLHSRIEMPPNLLLNDDGYIEPATYIKKDIVESIFRSANRMRYFLSKSSKAKSIIDDKLKSGYVPSFKDGLLFEAAKELCMSMFQKQGIANLTNIQTIELIRQLQYRFSAAPDQIARVTGLDYTLVSKLLDTV